MVEGGLRVVFGCCRTKRRAGDGVDVGPRAVEAAVAVARVSVLAVGSCLPAEVEVDAGRTMASARAADVGGTCQARSAGKTFLSCLSTFWFYKYNQSFW